MLVRFRGGTRGVVRRVFLPPVAALAAVALLSGTAAAQQRLSPDFQPPQVCGSCHETLYAQFQGSMHSQAAVDPLYLYEVRLGDEQTDGAVGTFCLKCHSPIGDMLGETAPPTGASDGSALSEISKAGVTCDFCHTVSGRAPGPLGNGSFESDPGLVKRGPYKDSVSPGHDTAYSELHTTSEFCGTCHDVNHPVNGLALEATYTEWAEGEWAKAGIQCQDCHMTPGPGPAKPEAGVAATFGPERDAVYEMSFKGANMVFGDPTAAEELLKSAATLELTIEGADTQGVNPGDAMRAVVKVKNVGAGHYLPTGLTDTRRMWLEVTAVAGKGDPVELGRVEYHTVYSDAQGNHDHVPVWFADSVYSDHRIPPAGIVTEAIDFVWPEGLSGDTRVVAELKYMSFTQELADTAGLGVQVPVVLMAQAERSVKTLPSKVVAAVALGVAAALVIGLAAVFLRSGRGRGRAGSQGRRGREDGAPPEAPAV
ncbi:MAG: multiheme c-type cytochrome [Thermoleophilia bacterium]